MCGVCKLIGALAAIGALNWGLVAWLDFNLVAKIFGDMTMGSKIVYGLVGVSGLLLLVSFVKPCPCCCKKTG
ncbi:MAG: DUF378 domain-containing protein [Deltaproteobacteria bacterium]|nr:DUF378 domain-containing protein [Deltaproteobacteria bacterium]